MERRPWRAETGQGHYPAMVALHTGLLAACPAEVWLADRPFVPALAWPMLAVLAAAQALRWWCIHTLGPRWNTRVIVVPGLPLVTGGPYRWRWLRHPNYVAVVAEGVALPLVHTAWVTAVRVHGTQRRPAHRPHPLREPALADATARPRRPRRPRPRGVIDVLVAGGGPAGLAAAIHAALAGLETVVVEPRTVPVDKACGEGVMPGGVAALRALGVEVDRPRTARHPLPGRHRPRRSVLP